MTSLLSRFIAALAALAAVLTSASCAGGVDVDPSLRRAQAERQVVTYLTDVLAHLPPQLFLSFDEPSPGRGRKDPGITVPCVDDNTVKDPPENYQVDYWVHGVPAGGFNDAISQAGAALTSMGWDVKTDPSGDIRAYSHDGYAVVGTLNIHGGLTLGASSPCFANALGGATGTEATAIPHP